MVDLQQMERTIFEVDEAGVRLEVIGGLPVWETSPTFDHQETSFRIQSSIRPVAGNEAGCACVHAADVLVRFPDGSLKRPDIAIFCRKPDEKKSAVTLVPEAVVEILSEGYEAKDLEVGVPFYKLMGIPDIIIFDPNTKTVLHYAGALPARKLTSLVEITLACGCRCTV
jgi:Uma2 family endonuclease